MKNILLTGGAGFVGSHTCLALMEKGYNVFVIDSFVNSSPKALERVLEIYRRKKNMNKVDLKIFNIDLCSKDCIKKVFLELRKLNKNVDGVIHFAGLKAVSESVSNPLLYWRINILGTINLLEVMQEFDCRNLVFSSSATIYKQNENSLIKEVSDLGPINPYGNTKLTVELILKDLFVSSENYWNFASLRYFNPIGAHETGLLGECPKGIPNNIFPLITNTAFSTNQELSIYGNDWPTEDGTPVRDYIHVMDLAESHLKILEYLFRNRSTNLSINVGTGRGTSVLTLIKIFEKINNVKIKYKFAERRKGDKAFVVADNSLLISKFDLEPKRTIEDMCRDGWKWKKLNPYGFC